NGTRFIVSTRMQCRNTCEIGRLGHVLGVPVGGLIADVAPTNLPVPPYTARVCLLNRLSPVRLIVVVFVLTVGVVLVLVTVVVLHEAEVDRHFPHGTGHPSVLPACTRFRQPFRPHAWDIT